SCRCASSATPPLNIVNTTIPVVVQYAIDFVVAFMVWLLFEPRPLWVSVIEMTDELNAVRQGRTCGGNDPGTVEILETRPSWIWLELAQTRMFWGARKENRSMQRKQTKADSSAPKRQFVVGLWAVRYQVKDVQRSIAFYTQTFGFNLDRQNLPAFGQVSIG